MTVLVTGAAGFIGSHLVDHLLEAGDEVVGLDSFDPFYPRSTKERNLIGPRSFEAFTEVEGDIRDRQLLDSLPEEIDAVVHLAALAGVRPSIQEPLRYTSVNIDGTSTVLEWARSRGIRRIVFASSSSVYGNSTEVPFREDLMVDRPISPYAATKSAGELICHTYHHLFDMSILALRFFTVYGPRQRPDLAIHKFARLMLSGEPVPMFGDGSTQRDYTYIDDIVQGVVAALRWVRREPNAFEVVNLGESTTISLAEMISTLAERLGVEPQVRTLPLQAGDVARTYADVTKARRLLGYSPSTSFPDGIERFLDWLARQPKS